MKLNKYIDHTNLKPTATKADIENLCAEAKEYDFKSVCINPYRVALAKELLKDSDVKVCTVIGFPLGANTTEIKVAETKKAFLDGCDEFDMVINVAALKDGMYEFVQNEISAIRKEIPGRILKVIIETGLLEDNEKIIASKIACEAGADFVKTCTGISPGKATADDIRLIRSVTEKYEGVKIKASGGVKTYEDAIQMVNAGADRIGASAGVQIMLNE